MKEKIYLPLAILFLLIGSRGIAQVLNPADPIVVYDSLNPPTQPPAGEIGKWVIDPTVSWDTKRFKSYVYKGVEFRLGFPNNYNRNSDKNYPMIVALHDAGSQFPFYNNDGHLSSATGLVIRDALSSGKYDGFYLAPHAGNNQSWYSSNTLKIIDELVQLISSTEKIDKNKIVLNGRSGGAFSVWKMLTSHQKTYAGAIIISGAESSYAKDSAKYMYSPIWLFQGLHDTRVPPEDTRVLVEKLEGIGANLKYTEYSNSGHAAWNRAYDEPDYLPFLIRANQTNPHVFFGRNRFCEEQPVQARLGIMAGFYEYQWRRDSVIIENSNSNELIATQEGSYSVRFKRTVDSEWTYWSVEPAVIRKSSLDPIEIKALGSTNLPTPTGIKEVTLEVVEQFDSYSWSNGATTKSIKVSTAGDYSATVGNLSCPSINSNVIKVVVGNGAGTPAKPTDFTASLVSGGNILLNWTDASNNETGFEIYRSLVEYDDFEFVTKVSADSTSYLDSALVSNLTYYYKIRSVNNNGGSGVQQANVFLANSAPVLKGDTIYNVGYDDPYTMNISATDNEGELLTFTVENLPAFASINDSINGFLKIELKPTPQDVGVYNNIIVKATDESGGVATLITSINVSGLKTEVLSKNSVKLNWSDVVGESGYEVMRSPDSTLNYAVVATLPADSTEYVDNTLVPAKTYYYKIKRLLPTPSFTNDKKVKTYTYSVRLNMNVTNPADAPWNNTNTPPDGSIAFSDLLDEENNPTSITVKIIEPFDGYNDLGVTVPGDSGVLPNKVMKSAYWLDYGNQAQLEISGLTPSSPYSFQFFGSSSTANENRTAIYEIGGKSVSSNASGNGTEIVRIDEVQASEEGKLILTVGPEPTAVYGYLNALIIEAYDSLAVEIPELPSPPTSLTLVTSDNSSLLFSWEDDTSATDGYVLMRSSATDTLTFTYLDSLSSSTLTYLDSGLMPHTSYAYQLYSYNAAGASDTIADVFTTQNTEPVLDSIADLELTLGETETIAGLGTDADGDSLFYKSENLPAFASLDWQNDGNYSINFNPTLADTGSYMGITVILYDGYGGETSQMFNVTVPDTTSTNPPVDTLPGTTPNPPGEIIIGETTPTSIQFTWADNADDETGYIISSGIKSENTEFSKVDSLQASATSYLDTALLPHTTYVYQLVAYNEKGESTVVTKEFSTGNSMPFIDSIANQLIMLGEQTTLTGTASDPDGDELTFSLENAPDFMSLTPNEGGTGFTITFEPGDTGISVYENIKVLASDGFGGDTSVVFNVTLNGLNADAKSDSSILLQWAGLGTETGFEIWRSLPGEELQYVTEVESSITNFMDSGLDDSTEYVYIVKRIGVPAPENTQEARATTFKENDIITGGLDDLVFSNLKVFPNPFTDRLQIQFESNQFGKVTIFVRDILGKAISSQTSVLNSGDESFELQTSHYLKGIYFVELHFESGERKILKVIKN